MRTSVLRAALLGGLLLAIVGCGGSRGINKGGKLTGAVTIDGKPVTAGTVLIVSEDDQYSVAGFINEFGTYTVKEPPLGPCKVAVKTRDKAGSVRPKAAGTKGGSGVGSAGMVLPPPEEVGLTYVPTPEHYEDPKTSGLSVVVAAGDQKHDLPLTRKK